MQEGNKLDDWILKCVLVNPHVPGRGFRGFWGVRGNPGLGPN